MDDKDNFDMPSDDVYDDVLDDNFEFDDDYDDAALDSDVDDFQDEYDDDWDEDGQAESGYADDFQPKKSKLNFNTIVIGITLIVGVFIMLAQIKPKPPEYGAKAEKSKFTTALTLQGHNTGPGAIKKEAVESLELSADKERQDQQEEGFLFNSDALDVAQDVVPDTPPMPSPIISEQDDILSTVVEGEAPVTEDSMNEKRATNEVNKALSSPPMTILEGVEIKDTPRAPSSEEIAPVEKDQEIVDVNPIVNEGEQPVETASVLDDGLGSEMMEDKIMSETMESPSLDKKLDLIIQRLDGMEEKIKSFQDANNKQITTITDDIDSLKIEASSKVSVKKAQPSSKAVVKKSKKSKTPKKKAVTPKKIVWELRAAQPGKAWISQKGQSDMRPVVVGDQLPSIGRVNTILYQNGMWVVQGSSGKITQ